MFDFQIKFIPEKNITIPMRKPRNSYMLYVEKSRLPDSPKKQKYIYAFMYFIILNMVAFIKLSLSTPF